MPARTDCPGSSPNNGNWAVCKTLLAEAIYAIFDYCEFLIHQRIFREDYKLVGLDSFNRQI